MASRRLRGPGIETPSKAPKNSGGPCRRGRTALRGRLSSAMCTPVPAHRRRLRKNETVSPTATAVRPPDSTGSQQQATPSQAATPLSTDVDVTSPSNVLLASTATAAPSPSSSTSDEEVETMRCSRDRGDQSDSESVIDVGAPCSFLVPQGSCCFGGHDASSFVVSGRGRAGPASDGPFNSTMVEGGVPLHKMPTPVMSTGVRSTRTVVPETDNDTALESPPLPPAPPTPTGVIPPCPLGLHRQIVLSEMRRNGVMFSWQLPR